MIFTIVPVVIVTACVTALVTMWWMHREYAVIVAERDYLRDIVDHHIVKDQYQFEDLDQWDWGDPVPPAQR